MKVHVKPHDPETVPAWPFVGLGLGILGAIGVGFRLLPDRFSPPCGFHLAFGHPCPSCGVTRMGYALMKGDLLGALRLQPFFFLVIGGLALWFAGGLVARLFRRDLLLTLSPWEERWGWLALLLAFFGNWIYLWNAGV